MPTFAKSTDRLKPDGPLLPVRIAIGGALEEHFRAFSEAVPPQVPVQALIDTGAFMTAIHEDIPRQLGLQPVGRRCFHTPPSYNVECDVYWVRLVFSKTVTLDTTAIAAPKQGRHTTTHCLIGRDVLARSVLVYHGHESMFSLSF